MSAILLSSGNPGSLRAPDPAHNMALRKLQLWPVQLLRAGRFAPPPLLGVRCVTAEAARDRQLSVFATREDNSWTDSSGVWGDIGLQSESERPPVHSERAAGDSGALRAPWAQTTPQNIEAPSTCTWSSDQANAVKVIGIVGMQPEVKHLSGGQIVAQVSLGLPQRSSQAQKQTAWIKVDFWGREALQVQHYVAKGMSLAIGGRLRKESWTTSAGDSRSVVKVVADHFSIVVPEFPAQGQTPGQQAMPNSGLPAATAQQSMQNPAYVRGSSGPGMKAQAIASMWAADPSLTWGIAAARNGMRPERALDCLVECSSAGLIEDQKRLASQLHIGPEGSPWLSFGTISWAIEAAQAAAVQSGMPSELERLRVKPVRELLAGDPQAGSKVLSQEQQLGERLGPSLTYSQIRWVLGNLQRGQDWSSQVTEAPQPITEMVGEAMATVSGDPPF